MERYLLVGLGSSNVAVANDLINRKMLFDVYLDDKNSILGDFLDYGCSIFNDLDNLDLNSYKQVIKSPGIPFSHPVIKECESLNIQVTNEIGYSLSYVKQPILAITGTNGKTTTTSLIEHILNKKEEKAVAVGNIGNSFLKEVLKEKKMLITELSSFQLRDLKHFNPEISIWLNVFSAHLDYHKTMDDYVNSKKQIFINQSSDKLFVYNEDDPCIKELAKFKKGNKKSFSLFNKNADAYFDGNYIFLDGLKFIHKDEIEIKGLHNIQNAMASILATLELSKKSTILEALKDFNGVPHRLEKVVENNTYKIYNDSKSTNTTAVKAALSAFNEPITLMMGGLDRGNSYDDLIGHLDNVKTLICFGQSGDKLYNSFKNHIETILEPNLDNAIELAKNKISSGGLLLFSPGCASWDQFSNFEVRGSYFKDKVLNG